MRTLMSYLSLLFLIASVIFSSCYYDEEVVIEGLPTNVSLKNDLMPIFTSNCNNSGCHDATPTHAPSLVQANVYNALVNGGYVNLLDPQSSLLYQEIEAGNMPPSGNLNENDKKIILGWIADGAKNN